MPLISATSVSDIVADILECQVKWELSDASMGLALLGQVSDPGKTVRSWKTGTEPTPPAIQSFLYLKALVSIASNSPLDAEENYSLAHSALPDPLQ